MKWYGALFLPTIYLMVENAGAAGFLQAQKFPGTFSDLSFTSRLEVLADGYDDVGVEYDENGRCVSGCAYQGITLAEEEQLMVQASNQLQQAIVQEQQVQAQSQPQPPKPQSATTNQQPPQLAGGITLPQRPPAQSATQTTAPGSSVTTFFRPPVAGSVKVGSDFGERRPPRTSNGTGSRYHRGLDIKASQGTPLYATADGVVIEAGKNGGYGNVVKIQHAFSSTDKTATTVYAHLSKIDVKKGQQVSQGQLIGKAGNTGNSGGAHLHYELRFDDIKVDPLGAYVAPIVDSNSAVAASTRGTNYLGANYCFKSGITSKRLKPFAGDNQALQENFPGCTGWCSSY